MLEFKLGCYKSYPLTGISSRDSGLASKEIRIALEFKNGVLQLLPPYRNLVPRFWWSSSAPLLGMVTPLYFARLDLLVPSNSLRCLQYLHRMLGAGQIPAQGLIGLIEYSCQQVVTSFPEAGLQRTPRLSMLGPEKFGDGWPTGKFFLCAHEWGQSVQKKHVLACEDSLCPS